MFGEELQELRLFLIGSTIRQSFMLGRYTSRKSVILRVRKALVKPKREHLSLANIPEVPTSNCPFAGRRAFADD